MTKIVFYSRRKALSTSFHIEIKYSRFSSFFSFFPFFHYLCGSKVLGFRVSTVKAYSGQMTLKYTMPSLPEGKYHSVVRIYPPNWIRPT